MTALASRQPADTTFLNPGERMVEADGVPAVQYFRPGEPDKPLLVFFSGGAHLARIAYGHPGCIREDFLDAWLERQGWGLLALSHPIAHPVFAFIPNGIDVSRWAAAAAKFILDVLATHPNHRVFAAGWSMSGRLAQAISAALQKKGCLLSGFLALAGNPPVPGLGPIDTAETPITSEGLRSFTARNAHGTDYVERCFEPELKFQNQLNGHVIIPIDIYRSQYVGDNPLHLHGEPLRFRNTSLASSYEEAIADVGTFQFAQYPVMGAIVPTERSDFRSALVDRALWGAMNALRLADLWKHRDALDAADQERLWEDLRHIVEALPGALCRTIRGGHFFFVGAVGANATVVAIEDLATTIADLRLDRFS
ncbi:MULTISPECIES: hypothetical protein [unclassified Sinorhizobium]|uniref:hypothetical protein n=1 Tax=unclassified Sinorhizobium TaxID=2613772 RepID=UPI0024C2D99C|nr:MULTISPECIES: hypothetical protein [unclassified Sinorhizobium]MDK1378155.1 hypothetical protein [Sinorhizobium sp. 6-70]MDK1479796.1 hypothetical protein [Sinorhizobium sp. 6-117]